MDAFLLIDLHKSYKGTAVAQWLRCWFDPSWRQWIFH